MTSSASDIAEVTDKLPATVSSIEVTGNLLNELAEQMGAEYEIEVYAGAIDIITILMFGRNQFFFRSVPYDWYNRHVIDQYR